MSVLRMGTRVRNAGIIILISFTAFTVQSAYSRTGDNRSLDRYSDSELNRIGMIKLRACLYEDARRYFHIAIRKNPTVKYYYNNISAACIKQGDYVSARKYLRIALTLDPRYVKALSNMAVICFYEMRFREAYHYYQQARSIDNGYTSTRFKYERIKERLEKMRKDNPENDHLDLIIRHLKDQKGD